MYFFNHIEQVIPAVMVYLVSIVKKKSLTFTRGLLLMGTWTGAIIVTINYVLMIRYSEQFLSYCRMMRHPSFLHLAARAITLKLMLKIRLKTQLKVLWKVVTFSFLPPSVMCRLFDSGLSLAKGRSQQMTDSKFQSGSQQEHNEEHNSWVPPQWVRRLYACNTPSSQRLKFGSWLARVCKAVRRDS